MKRFKLVTLRGAAVALSLFACAAASADTKPYTMTVFEDVAYGNKVVAGRYTKAIERITQSPRRYADDVMGQTNLCVAYAKTEELDKAFTACESVVAKLESRRIALSARAARDYAQRQYATELAVALSNRGVLRAATGDEATASADFERAASLESGVSAPAINLALLSLDSVASVVR
ncbi:MAG: hypothetical protein AAF184_21405 [Pseudomonadota bacterium]